MELDRNNLVNVLKGIEKAADITILHASVIGAHDSGLARKDSNTNVLFVYADKLEKYFSIPDQRQIVNIRHDNIELAAFSLKKTLAMIASSSTTAINMLSSKQKIISSLEVFKELENFTREYYNPSKMFRAFTKGAKHAASEVYSHKEVKIKIFLNYIKMSLALNFCSCYGLMENDFVKLVKQSKLSPKVKNAIFIIVEEYKQGRDYVNVEEHKDILEAIERILKFTRCHSVGAPEIDYKKLQKFHMKTILRLHDKSMYLN